MCSDKARTVASIGMASVVIANAFSIKSRKPSISAPPPVKIIFVGLYFVNDGMEVEQTAEAIIKIVREKLGK